MAFAERSESQGHTLWLFLLPCSHPWWTVIFSFISSHSSATWSHRTVETRWCRWTQSIQQRWWQWAWRSSRTWPGQGFCWSFWRWRTNLQGFLFYLSAILAFLHAEQLDLCFWPWCLSVRPLGLESPSLCPGSDSRSDASVVQPERSKTHCSWHREVRSVLSSRMWSGTASSLHSKNRRPENARNRHPWCKDTQSCPGRCSETNNCHESKLVYYFQKVS